MIYIYVLYVQREREIAMKLPKIRCFNSIQQVLESMRVIDVSGKWNGRVTVSLLYIKMIYYYLYAMDT